MLQIVFVRTGYHTQVPEISGKLNRKKISFHMGHITFASKIYYWIIYKRTREEYCSGLDLGILEIARAYISSVPCATAFKSAFRYQHQNSSLLHRSAFLWRRVHAQVLIGTLSIVLKYAQIRTLGVSCWRSHSAWSNKTSISTKLLVLILFKH
jgi:hypothetical protein